jgi:hypothetical protein
MDWIITILEGLLITVFAIVCIFGHAYLVSQLHSNDSNLDKDLYKKLYKICDDCKGYGCRDDLFSSTCSSCMGIGKVRDRELEFRDSMDRKCDYTDRERSLIERERELRDRNMDRMISIRRRWW